MSNDLHWDPVAKRMRPGLALYKADIEAKIAYGQKCLVTMTADGATQGALDIVSEQIATWRALLVSLDSVPV